MRGSPAALQVMRVPTPWSATTKKPHPWLTRIPTWSLLAFLGIDLFLFDLLIGGIRFVVNEVDGTFTVGVGFSGAAGAMLALVASLLIDSSILIGLALYAQRKVRERREKAKLDMNERYGRAAQQERTEGVRP